MGRKAVVAGATGLVGKELVQLLLHSPAYDRVVILARRTGNVQHAKLVEKTIDFETFADAEFADDFQGADVFCTLGTTMKKARTKEAFRRVDRDYPYRFGRLAKQAGAGQFLIVTAMGAKRDSAFFYNQVKGQIEEDLIALHLPALYLFRPSLLLGKREEFRLAERCGGAAAKAVSFAMLGPLRKYKPIHARTVAQGMLAAAVTDRPGTHLYQSDQIAALAKRFAER